MGKTRLKGKGNGIWRHNTHLDININLEDLPFVVEMGEVLSCYVKSNQHMGIKLDDTAHLYVGKIASGDFWKWFDKNMIYCEDTHSFVHRLAEKLGYKDSNNAQNLAFEIISEMRKEFETKYGKKSEIVGGMKNAEGSRYKTRKVEDEDEENRAI